ncbi:MAG: PelD GGDEF domain-containing protein [Burkholderiales bacterium]|nr:PelD GGDEF domain-containing protein [Burkholderiales bacterium]
MADKAHKIPSAIEEGEAAGLRFVIPHFGGPWVWVETVAITLLAMALSAWANPADPFFIDAQFPWPWFAPALIALRYGVMPGVVSSALLLAGWYWWTPTQPDMELPKLYFLGGLLLAMVCGEFSGLWRTRLRHLAELNLYLEDRVERVTKRFYLLRLSHDRLEQDMLAKPTTLRDALAGLRRRVAAASGGSADSALPGTQALLEFLAQVCQLEVAAVYATRPEPQRGFERAAAIGEPPPLVSDDALLVHAQANGSLAHVRSDIKAPTLPTSHLVIAPIVASDKRWLGVLAVSRMPFFALTEENMQTLAVLLSAYADGVTAADHVLPLVAAYPGLPIDFAEELLKLTRIQREFNLSSHIVVLEFGEHPARPDIFNQVLRQRRTPDVTWSIDDSHGHSVLVNLMPLAGPAAVDGYLLRTEMALQEIFGGNFQALRVRASIVPLTDPQPLASIKRILTRKR